MSKLIIIYIIFKRKYVYNLKKSLDYIAEISISQRHLKTLQVWVSEDSLIVHMENKTTYNLNLNLNLIIDYSNCLSEGR